MGKLLCIKMHSLLCENLPNILFLYECDILLQNRGVSPTSPPPPKRLDYSVRIPSWGLRVYYRLGCPFGYSRYKFWNNSDDYIPCRAYVSVSTSMSLFISMPMSMSVSISLHLSVTMSVSMSVTMSVTMSVYMSVSMSCSCPNPGPFYDVLNISNPSLQTGPLRQGRDKGLTDHSRKNCRCKLRQTGPHGAVLCRLVRLSGLHMFWLLVLGLYFLTGSLKTVFSSRQKIGGQGTKEI